MIKANRVEPKFEDDDRGAHFPRGSSALQSIDVSDRNLCYWNEKMTGGTPEVRSDKSFTLMTFNIPHSTNGPMDQWTNGLLD